MPDYDHGYKPGAGTAGFVSEGGHSIDWSIFDRKVDLLDKDALRAALKLEARHRADGTLRVNEIV